LLLVINAGGDFQFDFLLVIKGPAMRGFTDEWALNDASAFSMAGKLSL